MTTVKQLIDGLKKLPQDSPVVITSMDDEFFVEDFSVAFPKEDEAQEIILNAYINSYDRGEPTYEAKRNFLVQAGSELPEELLSDFLTDLDKVDDMLGISKEAWLESYSYMTEREYDITYAKLHENLVENLANLMREAENLHIKNLNGRPSGCVITGEQLKHTVNNYALSKLSKAEYKEFCVLCNSTGVKFCKTKILDKLKSMCYYKYIRKRQFTK